VSGRRIRLAPRCSADAAIAAITTEQQSGASRTQLLNAGVERGAIDRRLRNGHLVRWHAGVYLIGGAAPVELMEETAALLACGPTAMLSHHSAATLWGFRPGTARPIHVMVPAGHHGRGPDGVIVHRSEILLPCDMHIEMDLPVTSPARTMLDVAGTLPDRDLAYVVDEGLGKGLLTEAELSELLDRAGGHPGRRPLSRLLGDEPHRLTESTAQRQLLELIRDADLPLPETEVPLLDYRVDLFWRDLRLVVEVDGYRGHGTRRAFERDRRRDARLHAAGFVVIRFSARVIERQPLAVIASLAQSILAQTRLQAASLTPDS
jgi:very-short-patch-repair endonuclease